MLEQTDDEHYITMPEIKEELARYDITADRKSIYADLRDLEVLGSKSRESRMERAITTMWSAGLLNCRS